MKEKIAGLIRLQDFDNRIRNIIAQKKEGAFRIKRLEDELIAREIMFKEDSDRLESFKKDRRGQDQVVQELENRMEKSQIKLSAVKSNKEYTAMLKEIDILEREKILAEDKVLQNMEEIETLEKKCLENRDTLAVLKEKFEKDKQKVKTELEGLDRESEQIEKQREDCCKSIDKELLNNYYFLKERKGGVAIGSVIGGICKACNLKIPPQQFNELIRCKTLMICPSCNRMIYWGEDDFFINVLTGNKQPQNLENV